MYPWTFMPCKHYHQRRTFASVDYTWQIYPCVGWTLVTLYSRFWETNCDVVMHYIKSTSHVRKRGDLTWYDMMTLRSLYTLIRERNLHHTFHIYHMVQTGSWGNFLSKLSWRLLHWCGLIYTFHSTLISFSIRKKKSSFSSYPISVILQDTFRGLWRWLIV